MELYLVRKLNALYPAHSQDSDHLHQLPVDEVLKCKVVRPRNIGHHRKLFALLGLVFDNLPEGLEEHFKNIDDLLYEMKLQTGHREKYRTLSGREVIRVKSIAFDKMPQDEFQDFYDQCLVVICKYILPEITSEDLKEQLIQF